MLENTMPVEKAPKVEKTAPKVEKTVVANAPVEAKAAPAETAKSSGGGEGQKAVTQAYKDNWNDIFGKKKKR
jgi:hypothetical protein